MVSGQALADTPGPRLGQVLAEGSWESPSVSLGFGFFICAMGINLAVVRRKHAPRSSSWR